MATIQPISTVSYNTEDFLLMKLKEFYNAHIIREWYYIKHKGEDGDKDHIHLRVVPNRRIDPMEFQDELKEYTPDNPKPLGCIGIRYSKEEDWILYVVHDKDYLKQKYNGGEKGEKIPYEWTDIVCSDDYMLENKFIRAKATIRHSSASIAQQIKQGKSSFDLILEGENPHTVNAIAQSMYRCDYKDLQSRHNSLCEQLEILGFTPILNEDGVSYHLISIEELTGMTHT